MLIPVQHNSKSIFRATASLLLKTLVKNAKQEVAMANVITLLGPMQPVIWNQKMLIKAPSLASKIDLTLMCMCMILKSVYASDMCSILRKLLLPDSKHK